MLGFGAIGEGPIGAIPASILTPFGERRRAILSIMDQERATAGSQLAEFCITYFACEALARLLIDLRRRLNGGERFHPNDALARADLEKIRATATAVGMAVGDDLIERVFGKRQRGREAYLQKDA